MTIEIPFDREAELVVIASAVGHPAAWLQAVEHLTSDAFYDAGHAALFDACAVVGDLRWPACGVSWRQARIEAIATVAAPWAGDPDHLAELVDSRAGFATSSGARWIERVEVAWRRRETMATAAEIFNRIGQGSGLEEVAPLIGRLVAA